MGLAKLESGVNRERDFDLEGTPKTEEIVLDLGDRDENDVIDALFAADANYGDDLAYELFPDGDGESYNSNSYVSGILKAIGIAPPELESEVPGYDQPVPQEEFENEPRGGGQ